MFVLFFGRHFLEFSHRKIYISRCHFRHSHVICTLSPLWKVCPITDERLIVLCTIPLLVVVICIHGFVYIERINQGKKTLSNAWFPPFRCRSAIGRQPISILVSSSLYTRKDVSSISVLICNGNGGYGTEERQRYNGTAQRNGKTATEWWKPGIS